MSPFFYSYLITDPEDYGTDPDTFEKKLTTVLKKYPVDIICFRDKITQDIEPLAKVCLEVSKQFNISKILINGNIALAQKLGFDGVHLTSMQFDKIKEAKDLNLYTLVSAHSKEDIELIKNQGADGVTYSPIFYKEDKGSPKGCEALQDIVNRFQDEQFCIFALGGITDEKKIAQVRDTHCHGFASIGYFCK